MALAKGEGEGEDLAADSYMKGEERKGPFRQANVNNAAPVIIIFAAVVYHLFVRIIRINLSLFSQLLRKIFLH